jgi:hypothetical protein
MTLPPIVLVGVFHQIAPQYNLFIVTPYLFDKFGGSACSTAAIDAISTFNPITARKIWVNLF